jgi:hypothetical protein
MVPVNVADLSVNVIPPVSVALLYILFPAVSSNGAVVCELAG